MTPRICDCGLFQQPADRCPTGRCKALGRVAVPAGARESYFARAETQPALSPSMGHRWHRGGYDPALAPMIYG